jgi:hypothetical protein
LDIVYTVHTRRWKNLWLNRPRYKPDISRRSHDKKLNDLFLPACDSPLPPPTPATLDKREEEEPTRSDAALAGNADGERRRRGVGAVVSLLDPAGVWPSAARRLPGLPDLPR